MVGLCDVLSAGDTKEESELNGASGFYFVFVVKITNVCEFRSLILQIDRVTAEQVRYARMGISKDGWQLFAEEGEMKMYKREEEVNGLVIDPLKACHFVHGFTAHEICHYFFKPEFRYEWESK